MTKGTYIYILCITQFRINVTSFTHKSLESRKNYYY